MLSKSATGGGGEVAEYAYHELGQLGGASDKAEYVDPMSGVYVTPASHDGTGSLYAEAEEMTVEVNEAFSRTSSLSGEEHTARPLVRKASTYAGFGGDAGDEAGNDGTNTYTDMGDGTVWEGDESDDQDQEVC